MKAQIEIMGLVVVVVLIALGIFFVIAFKTNTGPAPQVAKDYLHQELATNFILAWLKTDVPCGPHQVSVQDLVYDCAGLDVLQCDSCQLAEDSLRSVLHETLDVWDVAYQLNVTTTPPIAFSQHTCGPYTPKVRGFQPIALYPQSGQVLVTLDVCK